MSSLSDYHEDRIEQKFQAIETEISTPDEQSGLHTEIALGIYPLWYSALAKLNIPPPKWIVDQLIADESINIVSALPAKLKTWFVFDIAIHVALGTPLFGKFETSQTKVLIVDEESGPGRLRKRLQDLGIKEDAPIAIASYQGFKITKPSAESLIAYCQTQGIGLVIFDSLKRLHDADENTSKEMSLVMENFKRLAKAHISVLIIHHNRKPGANKGSGATEMRGSVDILAACDISIALDREGESRIVKVIQNKNRDSEEVPSFTLELKGHDDTRWFEYIGDIPKSKPKRVLAEEQIKDLLALHKRLFQAEIITALSEHVGEKTVTDTLTHMTAGGILILSKGEKNKTYYQLTNESTDE